MDSFNITEKIHALKSCTPITFAHLKSRDKPKSHSLHLNNYIEIYIYISGETDYIIEDSYYSLSAGDILVITPHEVHVPVLRAECDYERYYILIPPDAFESYSFNPLFGFLTKQKGHGSLISLDAEERRQSLAILSEISALCEKGLSDFDALLAYSMLIRFLCGICSVPSEKSRNASAESFAVPRLLRDILAYISTNPEKISGSSDIAKYFHISLPYLSSMFRKYVGVTVSEYLRTKKIALAKKLLEDGSTVTDACYECGFSDCSYFIKTFRHCIGITPNKYRENFKHL